jgi:hypothetical protein
MLEVLSNDEIAPLRWGLSQPAKRGDSSHAPLTGVAWILRLE